MTIIKNAIQTPDGTILHSTHQHDFVSHTDKNGKFYMVDGGNVYLRRTVHEDQLDLSVFSDDPHEKVRQAITWGTYGKSGKEPYKLVTLAEMTTEHIEAILETQTHISKELRGKLQEELMYRESI